MSTGKHHRKEKRRYPRFRATGLMVSIGGRLVKVIDISASGMSVQNQFQSREGVMPFVIFPSDGKRLDVNKGLHGFGVVVRQTDELVGIRFEPASLALVRLASEVVA